MYIASPNNKNEKAMIAKVLEKQDLMTKNLIAQHKQLNVQKSSHATALH